MKRPKLVSADKPDGGFYFDSIQAPTFPTGCTTLDLALGGGWAEDRIFNIVGDKSTGKTLLAIEAAANFLRKYPRGRVVYAECEAAFDIAYARHLGLPEKRVRIENDLATVEDLFKSLEGVIAKSSADRPHLYVVDSLDALSDKAEQDRAIDQNSFGANKPKQLSSLFRRLTKKCGQAHLSIGIISQVRDNMNATWGKKQTRSGGKALDFYASQVVWLSHTKRLKRTRNGVERVYGVDISALVEKNKVGPPFREAEFPIHFSYGVHDGLANLQWLIKNKRYKSVYSSEKDAKSALRRLEDMDDAEFFATNKKVEKAVRVEWKNIERDFAPKRKKY